MTQIVDIEATGKRVLSGDTEVTTVSLFLLGDHIARRAAPGASGDAAGSHNDRKKGNTPWQRS